MSYILDALRRAQAERERGRLPGLQSQPLAPLPDAGSAPPGRLRGPAVIAVAALLLAVALAAAWWGLRPAPAPSAVPVAMVPQPPPPAAAPTPAAPAAALPVVVSAPALPPPVVPPVVPAVVPPVAPAAVAPAPPLPPPAPGDTSPPAQAAAPAAATPLAALAPQLRRELPPLEVGGSVWSDSPASRFVIINGQLVHEGQAAAPGVVVERIAPRSAVLRWRELRIELPL